MEPHEEARKKALRSITVADHMLTVSYPLVRDTKVLLSVMENIFLGLTNGMGALLYYERKYKNIPPFHDNFDSKFNTFKLYCVDRFSISKEYLPLLLEVKSIIKEHKESPVEFVRKDTYVIANKDYNLKTFSISDVKDYLAKAKLFIEEVLSKIHQK